MKFGFYHIFCFILLTVSFSGRTFAQIYNVNADTVVATSKLTADSSIYVYYTHAKDSLLARCPVPGPASFKWTRYDTIQKTFNLPLPNSINDADSIVTGLPSGGYKVHITATGYDASFVAWVYIDSLSVSIVNKDNYDNLRFDYYRCDYTDFHAIANQPRFICNAKGKRLPQPNLKYYWSAEPPVNMYDKDTTTWLRLYLERMPYVKTKFYVYVKDMFGSTSGPDMVNYTPIISKAIIVDPPIYDTTHIVDGRHSAPFKVTFLNQSKNAVLYNWFFGDKDSTEKKDTARVSHTYLSTDTFRVRLITQSLEGCIDSTYIKITVDKGDIGNPNDQNPRTDTWPNMPNCFFPGSVKYPNFKIYNISIRQFRFTVLSRWGKKVYQYEGPDMLEWEGWNGNINGNGPEASDGIYYYVLEVISYDKVPDPTFMNPKGKYSGFFYLFRAK